MGHIGQEYCIKKGRSVCSVCPAHQESFPLRKMEARNRSRAPVTRFSFGLQRSLSPTGCFNSPSSSSAFKLAIHRALSPTRVNVSGGASSSSTTANAAAASSSINLAFDRSASHVRSAGRAISPNGGADPMKPVPCAAPRKMCMCSPTNHPGSFRCSLHRKTNNSSSSAQSQLNARRSAMTNSLVRIGGVEGEWVKRALTALIRPSSHHMRRRTSFLPRPSRLRHMIRAQDIP